MSDFTTDRAELLEDLTNSRAALIDVVQRLRPDDLQASRRGSWSVARVLDHVLHSEKLYTQLVSAFSGKAAAVQDSVTLSNAEESTSALNLSREVFLTAVEDVREEDFYRLQTIGHEEYSVLSILENNAAHDREHAEQIRKTLEQS